MKQPKIIVLFLLTTLAALVSSCKPDDPEPPEDKGFSDGIFIVNEGAFSNSNGSISWFEPDSAKLINHLFMDVNGRPLGDVVQSFYKDGNRGYIVVNNSQKMEIVDLKTFESLYYIDKLSYPRYFMTVDENKGYLTNGNLDGQVLVVDLINVRVTDTISVGSGPERMIRFNNQVFVANSGGWDNDSTISVINTITDEVDFTWVVGYNPVDMAFDANRQLWVLCKGKTQWNAGWTLAIETPTELVRINPESGEVSKRISIGYLSDYYWPDELTIDPSGETLYFTESGGFYRMSVSDDQWPAEPFLSKMFYGFEIQNGSRTIYGLEANSFTEAGYLFRYSAEGVLIDSLQVGIGPNQVVF